jgi:hypothetical protein
MTWSGLCKPQNTFDIQFHLAGKTGLMPLLSNISTTQMDLALVLHDFLNRNGQ